MEKVLQYFFRTKNLPDIVAPQGSTLYALDIHIRIITMLLRTIPEVDRAWIAGRDSEHPDCVYIVHVRCLEVS
jgi:hypothetical protein